MPPPRKRSRLTRNSRTFSGFKFYLGYLNITVILNLFQKFVIQKLGVDTGCFKNSRRRIGCQEVKLLSVLRTKIASLFSLPSCPLNFCSSDNDPLPCPPPREGACSRKFNQQSNACHCERQNGASQSHNLYNINEITTSNASHSPRNDIENSCKTQVSGAAATLHKGTRGIDFVSIIPSLEGRGSEEVGDTYPSSGTECHLLPHRGEGINKKILKHTGQSDVLDDRNISMKTEYCRKNLLLVRWMFIMENCNWQYGLI